ncbi:MAG: hypothetical protein ACRC7R_07205 [Sarcina sp.]
MAKRILLSFKETEIDQELLRHLEKYSKIVGASAYVKQLLYEDLIKKENDKK